MKWLACDYEEGQKARLHVYPELECWTGSHSLYAALAMLTLCVYLIASNVRPCANHILRL